MGSLAEGGFDVLVTDIMMPGMTGLELLTHTQELVPDLAVVIMTGFSTLDRAIKTLRAGAHDFLPKPFSASDLQEAVEHALSQVETVRARARLRALLPLLELNERTLQSVNMATVCSEILTIAVSETSADGGGLFLVSEQGEMALAANTGALPGSLSDCADWMQTLRQGVEPIIFTRDDAPCPSLSAMMRDQSLGTVLCSPLKAPGRMVGVLVLTQRDGQPPFRRGDLELTSVLGGQAAALMENVRLISELATWNSTLEARIEDKTRELEQALDRLLRAERLATVGKLGSGVAHELRNPLGVINNSAYYLKTRLGNVGDAKTLKHLEIIRREVDAANKIITDLMDFVRVSALHTALVDPNALVDRALERAVCSEHTRVQTALAEGLPRVSVDADKIEQVFLNLIQNADQAMVGGGELCISTAQRNGHVDFCFRDTGIGVPTDNLELIFEPLFSTKAKGIGLGLPLVKLLVEAHHGVVSVSSREGEGSVFTVSLPHSSEQ